MGSLPLAQWQDALDRMESALATAAHALDRREERYERGVAPSAGAGASPPALDRIDARLEDWDARLRAADELTASVERELAERASAVNRWRSLFAEWEELLKRK